MTTRRWDLNPDSHHARSQRDARRSIRYVVADICQGRQDDGATRARWWPFEAEMAPLYLCLVCIER
jgi:hypothetical protein